MEFDWKVLLQQLGDQTWSVRCQTECRTGTTRLQLRGPCPCKLTAVDIERRARCFLIIPTACRRFPGALTPTQPTLSSVPLQALQVGTAPEDYKKLEEDRKTLRKMAMRTFGWGVLLCALFPLQAIVGRQLVAGAPRSPIALAPHPLYHVPGEVRGYLTARYSTLAPHHFYHFPGGAVGGTTTEEGTRFQVRRAPLRDMQGKRFKQVNSEASAVDADEATYGQRELLGSLAPTCLGKCGSCIPCDSIHMTIGSPLVRGAITQTEYYPEVWRCKCGGVYFMP